MKNRKLMVILAVIMGVLAAFSITLYTKGIRTKYENDEETVKVLVADEDISVGKNIDSITKTKAASFQERPKKYVTSRALTSDNEIDGQVLAVPVNKNEIITLDHFKYNTKAGLSFTIPDNYVAISIPIDEVRGVSGMIKAGDLINVVATFKRGQTNIEDDKTKILLQNVKVLAVDNIIAPAKGHAEENGSIVVKKTSSTNQNNNRKTLTLSLKPKDSEKLVFAEELGSIWLTLLPATGYKIIETPSQTINSIFR